MKQSRQVWQVFFSLLIIHASVVAGFSALGIAQEVQSQSSSFETQLTAQSYAGLPPLVRAITLAQNRGILIQHTDGGWPFSGTPNSHRDTSQVSPPNLFGAAAVGHLNAYAVTREPDLLATIKRTCEVLLQITITPTNRIYPPDAELLARASYVLGFSDYMVQAVAAQQVESNYAAALFVINNVSPSPNNYDPTAAQVAAVTPALLATVTPAQRVVAYDTRLRVVGGRSSTLRGYDWYQRFKRAVLTGDSAFAQAIADQVAANSATYIVADPYYLIGIANTISVLQDQNPANPTFAPIIHNLLNLLLSWQDADGFFRKPGVSGLSFQEQAFSLQALLDTGNTAAISRLVPALEQSQAAFGGFVDSDGNEYSEVLADLNDALTNVWRSEIPALPYPVTLLDEGSAAPRILEGSRVQVVARPFN